MQTQKIHIFKTPKKYITDLLTRQKITDGVNLHPIQNLFDPRHVCEFEPTPPFCQLPVTYGRKIWESGIQNCGTNWSRRFKFLVEIQVMKKKLFVETTE